MRIDVVSMGPLQTNCCVVSKDGKAIVVDPGGDAEELTMFLDKWGYEVTHIINTHLHMDHTYGNAALSRATGAPILASEADRYMLDTELGAGGFMGLPRVEPYEFEPLEEGEREFLGSPCKVLATPGHSPGSMSLYFPEAKAVLVGDLIFYRSIGRTDFPGGDLDVLKESVEEKIFTLPGDTVIYSGHTQVTTVDDERNHNPFFSSFAS